MGLFESDKCLYAYDYILDLQGGFKLLADMMYTLLTKDITYYWSSPGNASKLKKYTKMFMEVFKIIESSTDDSDALKITIMKKVHRQLKYLLGLPKELQKEVTGSMRRQFIQALELSEPFLKVPSPTSGRSQSHTASSKGTGTLVVPHNTPNK
jgi:hypothetical protein